MPRSDVDAEHLLVWYNKADNSDSNILATYTPCENIGFYNELEVDIDKEYNAVITENQNEENIRIKNCILANKCPNNDNGKLIRKKKNKFNGYKRIWVCSVCNKSFIMPDINRRIIT